MTFAEKLRHLREQKRLSQEGLARRMQRVKGGQDITRDQITRWETGRNYPMIQKLILISDVFNVSLDDLCREGRKIN